VPVLGHRIGGTKALLDAVERNLHTPRIATPEFGHHPELERIGDALRERLSRSGVDSSRQEIREALIQSDSELDRVLAEIPELLEALHESRAELGRLGLDKDTIDVAARYEWAAKVEDEVVVVEGTKGKSTTDKLDLFLTHRVFGLAFFGLVMYVVFQAIYTFAGPLMDAIDGVFAKLSDWVSPSLEGSPVLQSLVVDGLIAGVGSVLLFLPQILILFFFIAVLEGTGYLARAAFLRDRLLGWCGLNGRAFIPLLSSFACAIPGVMAARVMPDPKSRLATILVAPLMSCSARLPVYILLIGAFIEPQFGPGWAGFALFAMHLVGLGVAIPVVFVLNRGLFKGKRLPFVLELPSYQWPKWRDVWLAMLFRAKVFLQTAGSIIVVLSVIIWALAYFPRSEERNQAYLSDLIQTGITKPEFAKQKEQYVAARQLEDSYLGQAGKAIEPAFIPVGFDWRLATAIMAAFPAREVVVAQLGIVFNQGSDVDEGSDDLRTALQRAEWPDGRKLVTPWTAIGFMVFFALCCQCMATLAAVKRETGSWKWPLFMFTYMSVLAYLGALLVHRIGLAFGG
nr:ferrous iron transporter B [Fimbriimonadaceae bacterium]